MIGPWVLSAILPGDGTTSHLATSFLDGLVSKQWTEATTVWSENGSSSLKFGSLSKISYDFDHRRSPAGQISWFWPSSLTLQGFFCFEKPYILAILIDGFVCLFAFAISGEKSSDDLEADGSRDGGGESCARGSSPDLAGTYVSGHQSGVDTFASSIITFCFL